MVVGNQTRSVTLAPYYPATLNPVFMGAHPPTRYDFPYDSGSQRVTYFQNYRNETLSRFMVSFAFKYFLIFRQSNFTWIPCWAKFFLRRFIIFFGIWSLKKNFPAEFSRPIKQIDRPKDELHNVMLIVQFHTNSNIPQRAPVTEKIQRFLQNSFLEQKFSRCLKLWNFLTEIYHNLTNFPKVYSDQGSGLEKIKWAVRKKSRNHNFSMDC